MFIRDSASPRAALMPNLPGTIKLLSLSNIRTFKLHGKLSWLPCRGIMRSCMIIVWTIATLFLMAWSRACALRSHRDERVACFRTLLMKLTPLVSSSVFNLSERWTRCILLLSRPCSLTRPTCSGIQVFQCNSRSVMVTRPTQPTFTYLRNNDYPLDWRISEDVLHTIHLNSWAQLWACLPPTCKAADLVSLLIISLVVLVTQLLPNIAALRHHPLTSQARLNPVTWALFCMLVS